MIAEPFFISCVKLLRLFGMKNWLYSIMALVLLACSTASEPLPVVEDEDTIVVEQLDTVQVDTVVVAKDTTRPLAPLKEGALASLQADDMSAMEQQLIEAGLVNVSALDSTIVVDLKYSTTDNFLNTDVYGEFDACYLQKEVADKLVLAQLFLKSKYPSYSIKVFDAVRPTSVQWKMWKAVDLPLEEKVKFLSNPANGSLHNYGAAVDVSIVDQYGEELDMATPFDYVGVLAHPEREEELLEQGLITEEQINNRKLLRGVMYKAGFFNIQTEWWHFNSCRRNVAKERYELVN